MDALKVQTEMLKKAYKNTYLGMTYGIWDDEHIALIPEGHYIALVPADKFFLSIKAIWGDREPIKLKAFKDAISDLKPVENTMTSKAIDKGMVRIFKFVESGHHVYIDERILKLFESKNTRYMGVDSHSPVYIYEEDELVGIVLPVRITKGE